MSTLHALESLLPKDTKECVPITRMAMEARLLDPLLHVLQFHKSETLTDEEGLAALEACKVTLRIVIKFSHGCLRTLKTLRRNGLHTALVA